MSTPETSSPARTSLLDRYTAADERLRAVAAAVPDWDAASPCQDWAARDVVAHLLETQTQFLGAHVDLGDDGGIADGEGAPLSDPAAAWAAHADRVRAALADPALAATEFAGFFGPTTVGATLETFYVFDMLVHRWDLGRAAGAEVTWDSAEMDFIERATSEMGEAIRMEGICGPAIEVPADADRQTRLLGFLGRAV